MTNKEILIKINKFEIQPKSKQASIDRGREFEKLINQYFDNEKVLIKNSYQTSDNKSEQIDAAIKVDNRVFLVETKWVESNLAASAMYAFMGKVDNKMYGTLGLFISKIELSENFIKSLAKGRQRKVIILHGDDIKKLFDEKFSFVEYISKAINIYSTDNVDYYSIQQYLDGVQNLKEISNPTKGVIDDLKDYWQLISTNEVLDDFKIAEASDKLSKKQKELIFQVYMKKLDYYYEAYHNLSSNSRAYRNIINSLEYLKIYDKEEIIETYWNKVIEVRQYSLIDEIAIKFIHSIDKVSIEKSKIYDVFIEVFENIQGSWEKENTLTDCIEKVWEDINSEQQIKLLQFYFDIYIDTSRQNRFLQKQFANKLISNSENNEIKKRAFNQWINKKMKDDMKNLENDEAQIKEAANYFSKHYQVYYNFNIMLELSKDDFIEEIKKMYIKAYSQNKIK
ncbi:MAG: hypothetical protein KU38_12745 [Sulfurovum sp. FS08-3]|nr:MAG: hypothetical protein KU38_12745 [Sulfurovum sp. FS08-3]